MMKLLWTSVGLAAFLSGAVVVDRIAVVVGKHVIKASDIDLNLRVTSFVNGQQLDLSPEARRSAANRLIDHQIIRDTMATQGYARATDQDAAVLQKQITTDRFGGSDSRLRDALQRYGLSEVELHDQLVWQLTVLRFIDERFRPGVIVSDEDIRTYYDQHLAQIQKESPKDYSLNAVADKIKAILEAERIDREFEAWLAESRQQSRIEFRDAAFK